MSNENAIEYYDGQKKIYETQLEELESLEAIYCQPGEIQIQNREYLLDIQHYISSNDSTKIARSLSYVINISVDERDLSINVDLPKCYPKVAPELFVRCNQLNNNEQKRLNKDLSQYVYSFITENDAEPCMLMVINWLQENASNYAISVIEDVKVKQETQRHCRIWIFSHHIYSTKKRQDILQLANDFNLTGFISPGKPGIICLEGAEVDCDYVWSSIKSMNWKKIACRKREVEPEISNNKAFPNFSELFFRPNGTKTNHTDAGELYKYLKMHDCGHVFVDLFGFEARD